MGGWVALLKKRRPAIDADFLRFFFQTDRAQPTRNVGGTNGADWNLIGPRNTGPTAGSRTAQRISHVDLSKKMECAALRLPPGAPAWPRSVQKASWEGIWWLVRAALKAVLDHGEGEGGDRPGRTTHAPKTKTFRPGKSEIWNREAHLGYTSFVLPLYPPPPRRAHTQQNPGRAILAKLSPTSTYFATPSKLHVDSSPFPLQWAAPPNAIVLRAAATLAHVTQPLYPTTIGSIRCQLESRAQTALAKTTTTRNAPCFDRALLAHEVGSGFATPTLAGSIPSSSFFFDGHINK